MLLLFFIQMTIMLLFLLTSSIVASFVVTPSYSSPFFSRRRWSLTSTIRASPIMEQATPVDPPSWEELSTMLQNGTISDEEEEPQLTFYRDTNGWCPFCERVWLALRVKGIPYRERLINLQDKPDWFKELVPTALVPAILLHNSSLGNNERRILWESQDILKALDEEFPETPQLMWDGNPDFDAAMELNEELNQAGFKYIYGKNQTDEERQTNRQNFLDKLDKLNEALQEEKSSPFRLGSSISGIDAIMMPALERWRYQLPLTEDLDILKNRPSLQKWFDVMDAYPPYANRVRGDGYSWTAVTSTFLRLFAAKDDPEVEGKINNADAATEQLTQSFANTDHDVVDSVIFAREAATKLITNHAAAIADCTSSQDNVKTQTQLLRASDATAADVVLRHVASILLSKEEETNHHSSILAYAQQCPLPNSITTATDAAAEAARTVAARLCVPRDMSAPAATLFRTVLTIVANRLVAQQ